MTEDGIILRGYQDMLVSAARERIAAAVQSLLLQSPAGSGKTVMAAYMVDGVRRLGKRAMFLVHREELARQAAKTFQRFGIQPGYVMSSMTMDVRKPVLIAMIDTLRNRLKKVPAPDLLLVDECHHAASATWQKIIQLYMEAGTVVIGLSATPGRLDGRPLKGLFHELIHGPQVSELIKAGALSNYTYFRPPTLVDLSGVKSRAGDYANEELAAASDVPAIIGDAVEHYKRVLTGKRSIAFAVNVRHSQHVAGMFNAAGIPAIHLDGETPPLERMRGIEAFARGDIKVMSNVALFGEGFDVPACEGVSILRATQSLALHIQVCGRAMRPHDGKGRAIILDHVNNLQRHGLPDEERDWTEAFEGRAKKKGRKKDDDDNAPPIPQCPKCYTVPVLGGVCHHCGFVLASAERKLEVGDGELVAVTESEKEMIARARRVEVAKAKTLEELEEIARQRKYKPGWAKHVFAARGGKSNVRL